MTGLRYTSGFTLIELMITVAVIAILASIAYPSYTQYVARANTAEAESRLMEGASAVERCYTENYSYSGCDPALTATDTYTFHFSAASGSAATFSLSANRKESANAEEACLMVDEKGQRKTTGCLSPED